MSLIMTGTEQPSRQRRNRLVATVGVACVAMLVLVSAYVLGYASPHEGPARGQPRAETAFAWSQVGTELVPASASTGPAQRDGALARGYAHDAVGAAVAAINISARISGSVPISVADATLRGQCFGDRNAAVLATARLRSTAAPESTRALGYWFRVEDGDPTGQRVVIVVAALTAQSQQRGSYVRVERTLRWVGGDWQMQVPPARPLMISSIAGYLPLGAPGA